MDLALQGKVAMITGGSHGLGKQAADSLAREGCKVAICARGQEIRGPGRAGRCHEARGPKKIP